MVSQDKEVILSFAAVAGFLFGMWGIGHIMCSSSYTVGASEERLRVQEEAISFGAAHRGPKGQFIWGPVTKRELEVAR